MIWNLLQILINLALAWNALLLWPMLFSCGQVSKYSRVPRTLSRFWNPNLLGAIQGTDNFLGHPSRLVPPLALLVDQVSHHLIIFLLEKIGCALFQPSSRARCWSWFASSFLPFLLIPTLIELVAFLMAWVASYGCILLKLLHHLGTVMLTRFFLALVPFHCFWVLSSPSWPFPLLTWAYHFLEQWDHHMFLQQLLENRP